MEPIISVSGLRGVLGRELTPEVAIRYVGLFANQVSPGSIVLTRDSRPSGAMLVEAIRSGLAAAGRVCLDGGIAPTPTTGVLIRHLEASGGIQVSASHNPPEYNGIKLFSSLGRVISASAGAELAERFRGPGSVNWAGPDQLGCWRPIDEPLAEHARAVLGTVDVEQVRGRRLRVLLDANHGAGGELGHRILQSMGCQVVLHEAQPDGLFSHPPEPTEENLAGVQRLVSQSEIDVAFCLDPDADRLAIIDSQGRYLGEEATLALCVAETLALRPGPIVTNCSTSRMSQDLAARYKVPFHLTPVGEANVVDQMLACGAVLGGEGNGGVIDPRVGLVRDSFVAMACVLGAMARRGMSVTELAAELPEYAIEKCRVHVDSARLDDALMQVARHHRGAVISRLDGLRLDWPDRWLLARASNTEPVVRVIAEAPTRDQARAMCEAASRLLAGDGAA
jgi:phosphomannomutase